MLQFLASAVHALKRDQQKLNDGIQEHRYMSRNLWWLETYTAGIKVRRMQILQSLKLNFFKME